MTKQFRIGLFGCEEGIWECALADAGFLQTEVVAVADSDRSRAEELARRLGVRAVVVGAEMVEAEIDVLLVSRPFEEARDVVGCAAMRGVLVIHAEAYAGPTNPGPIVLRNSFGPPFRVGVVGCGSLDSRLRIRAAQGLFADGVQVVAVADPGLVDARLVAADYGVRHAFGSLEEMLERMDLDAVIVVLPPGLQAQATITALEHGCHVLCQAPFGSTPGEAGRMIEAAGRAGRILMAGSLAPLQYAWSRDFVELGKLGTPELLTAEYRCPASTPHPEGLGAELAGQLLAAGLPMLASPPIAVSAVGWWDEGHGSCGSTIDLAQRISMMVDCRNGARGHFVVDSGWRGLESQASIRCEGSKGTLWTPWLTTATAGPNDQPTFVDRSGRSVRGEVPATDVEAIVAQLSDFVERARGGSEPLRSDLELAVDVQEVLDVADRSSALGGRELLF